MPFDIDEVLAMDRRNQAAQKKGFDIDEVLAMDKNRGVNNASGVGGNAKNYLLGLSQSVGSTLGYPLEKIAQAGRFVNAKNQQLSDILAEKGGYLEGRYGIPGAGLLGAEAGTSLGTLSQALVPQNKLAAGLMLLPSAVSLAKNAPSAVEGIINAVRGYAPEIAETAQFSKPGIAAQAIKAYQNISQGDAQFAIDHPETIQKAKSVEDATQDYVDKLGGLKGKVVSIGERLNKPNPSAADYDAAVTRTYRILNGTETYPLSHPYLAGQPVQLNPQDALEGLQTINQAMRFKQYTQALPPGGAMRLGQMKDQLMDYLDKTNPGLRQASSDLRAAYVKDAFSSWLPVNKFGDVNALRSVLAIYKGAQGIGRFISGDIIGGAADLGAASMASPRMGWSLIQNANAMSNPAVQLGAQAAGMGAANTAIPQ